MAVVTSHVHHQREKLISKHSRHIVEKNILHLLLHPARHLDNRNLTTKPPRLTERKQSK